MPTNSDNHNLEDWKLTLPIDSKGRASGTAKEVKNLIGYEDRFFYDAADGAMVFKASVDGATTSGSKSGSFSFPVQYRSGARPPSAGPRNVGRPPPCWCVLPSALTQ